MGENEKCNEISCECLCNGTSPQKYSCNTTTGQCFLSSNGSSLEDCLQGCQVGGGGGGGGGGGTPGSHSFCDNDGVCQVIQNTSGQTTGSCVGCDSGPVDTFGCVDGVCTAGAGNLPSGCNDSCVAIPDPDTGGPDGGPNARPDGGGRGPGGAGPETAPGPCADPDNGSCCCVTFDWCDKKKIFLPPNAELAYRETKKTITRKICNWIGGTPAADLCGIVNGMRCEEEDLSDLVRCCYRRNNNFTCTLNSSQNANDPADGCGFGGLRCNDADINWNAICPNISNTEAEEYLRMKTNSCCSCSTENLERTLYCCNPSCGTCPCTITGFPCGTLAITAPTINVSDTCTNSGDMLPESPSPTTAGFLIDYGSCRTDANGVQRCDFVHPVDPCIGQCIAVRDVCRWHECALAGTSTCPGVWRWGGCACPVPGQGYRDCPGSNVDPISVNAPVPDASALRVFRQIDKIENINALIEEVQKIDPVECSPMPSWYTPEAYPGIFPWCPEIEIEGYHPCYFYSPGYVMPKLPDDGIKGTPTFKVPVTDPVSAGACPVYKSIQCDLCKLCTADPLNQTCIDAFRLSDRWFHGVPTDAGQPWGSNPSDYAIYYGGWLDDMCLLCNALYQHEGVWWVLDSEGRWWILDDFTNIGSPQFIPYIPDLGVPAGNTTYDNSGPPCKPILEILPYYLHQDSPGIGRTNPIFVYPPDFDWRYNPSERKRTPKGFRRTDAGDCEGILGIQTTDTIIPPPVNRFKDSNIILVKVSLNNLDTCIPILCVDNCDAYELCE